MRQVKPTGDFLVPPLKLFYRNLVLRFASSFFILPFVLPVFTLVIRSAFKLFRVDVVNDLVDILRIVHAFITRDVAALFASVRAVGVRAFHDSPLAALHFSH